MNCAGLVGGIALTVDVADATTDTAGAVSKIGFRLYAKVASVEKEMDVKGRLLVEVAPSNCTRSEAGASASSSGRMKGTNGLRTLRNLSAKRKRKD